MTGVLTNLSVAVLIAAMVWWLAGVALAILYPALRSAINSIRASSRCRVLSCLAALPLGMALLTTLLLYLPATYGVGVAEHCHDGIGCTPHAPAVAEGMLEILLPILALSALFAFVWRLACPLWRQWQRAQQLATLARPEPEGGYAVVDTDRVFALTVGLLRPRVFISSALLAQLDAGECRSVLLHEQAHARRRDSLRQWVSSLCAPRLLTGPGRPLQQDLQAACEQACDTLAANGIGDPLQVAESIIKARRASRRAAKTANATDNVLALRIGALVTPPQAERLPAPLLVLGVLAAAVLVALLGLDALHHGAERMQAWISAQA